MRAQPAHVLSRIWKPPEAVLRRFFAVHTIGPSALPEDSHPPILRNWRGIPSVSVTPAAVAFSTGSTGVVLEVVVVGGRVVVVDRGAPRDARTTTVLRANAGAVVVVVGGTDVTVVVTSTGGGSCEPPIPAATVTGWGGL